MNKCCKDRNSVDRLSIYANELLEKIESGKRLNSILPIFNML